MPWRPKRERRSGWVRYDAEWRAMVARMVAAEPWCHTPGGCPFLDAGSGVNPLTGDHIVSKAMGGASTEANTRVVCRRCNSAKRER